MSVMYLICLTLHYTKSKRKNKYNIGMYKKKYRNFINDNKKDTINRVFSVGTF
jgi:hypothetical protein